MPSHANVFTTVNQARHVAVGNEPLSSVGPDMPHDAHHPAGTLHDLALATEQPGVRRNSTHHI